MRIDVFTIFPGLVDGFCAESLLGKARTGGLLDLRLHDLREHTTDVHRTVDDTPVRRRRRHGDEARAAVRRGRGRPAAPAAVPARPGGRRFDQAMADELAADAPARRVLAAVRPLRGHRPPGARAPRRRRAEHRRRRAERGRGGCVPGHRGRRAAAARRDGQPVSPVNESFGAARAARGAPVHPAGRVPRLGGARRAAQRRPRPHRALAARPGPAPHPAGPSRPASRPAAGSAKPTAACWKSSPLSPILERSLYDACREFSP